jgi:hypothetical protein
VATQRHGLESWGTRRDSGTAGIQSIRWTAPVPLAARIAGGEERGPYVFSRKNEVLLLAWYSRRSARAGLRIGTAFADAGASYDRDSSTTRPAPQINIDGNCTIRNYPRPTVHQQHSWFGNPHELAAIFDNVVHTGNMSATATRRATRSGSSTARPVRAGSLAEPLIPGREDRQAELPTGTTATIGVPSQEAVNPRPVRPGHRARHRNQGSLTICTASRCGTTHSHGLSLRPRGYTITGNDGTPVAHTSTTPPAPPTWDNIPSSPRGGSRHRATVVSDIDVAGEHAGRSSSTRPVGFGRLIRRRFYEPLPGQNGICRRCTIAAPVLVVDKSGPATMNMGSGDLHCGRPTRAHRRVGRHLRDLLPTEPRAACAT